MEKKKVKVMELSKEEFVDYMMRDIEKTTQLVELMESEAEFKFTFSNLMDISLALTSWIVGGDCNEQMGTTGILKALELKDRLDDYITKELKKHDLPTE